MKLKVICLNLWQGGKLFENIKSFIAEEKADMLALQEVHDAPPPRQEEWRSPGALARTLGYKHYAFAPAFAKVIHSGHKSQKGNTILSRFPITSSSAIFYDVPYNGTFTETPGDYRYTPRNLQHGEIDINGTTLHLFNTQGIWGFDGNDSERRLKMGEIITREIAGKQPALLMGDFNVREGTQTIKKIEAHMTNVFAGELKTSFNMRHKKDGGFATAVVDMMFASPDIKIGQHYASKTNVSDHLALVGEFEINV